MRAVVRSRGAVAPKVLLQGPDDDKVFVDLDRLAGGGGFGAAPDDPALRVPREFGQNAARVAVEQAVPHAKEEELPPDRVLLHHDGVPHLTTTAYGV